MPPLTDETEIEDLDSSAKPAPDETTAETDPMVESGEDANSSNATSETDDDLLSVVRDVRTKREKTATDAASQAAGEEDDGSKAGQPRKLDDENFSDAPFNKHPRFRQLLQQRNEFKVDRSEERRVGKECRL